MISPVTLFGAKGTIDLIVVYGTFVTYSHQIRSNVNSDLSSYR